jgi:hypothetical protein
MLSEIQREIMYDPLYSEMGVGIMKHIMIGIGMLEDICDKMEVDLLGLEYDINGEDGSKGNGGYFE